MGFGGRELERRAELLPGFFAALSAILAPGMVALPGGVLLRRTNGEIVGSVGASGDRSEHDAVCILTAMPALELVVDIGD